jgi:DNA-binding winged helix-turn-helix (wHTH) protein
LTLIQSPDVPKERIGMAHRTIDVHICHIRKALAPFGIAIGTIWGYGYQLSDPDRRKVMDLILSRVQGAPA